MKYNNDLLNRISELSIPENNVGLENISFLKKGSKIHIQEKNVGKFTKSAKAAGKSVQQHARDVVNNPNATKLQKRRAQFVINASK